MTSAVPRAAAPGVLVQSQNPSRDWDRYSGSSGNGSARSHCRCRSAAAAAAAAAANQRASRHQRLVTGRCAHGGACPRPTLLSTSRRGSVMGSSIMTSNSSSSRSSSSSSIRTAPPVRSSLFPPLPNRSARHLRRSPPARPMTPAPLREGGLSRQMWPATSTPGTIQSPPSPPLISAVRASATAGSGDDSSTRSGGGGSRRPSQSFFANTSKSQADKVKALRELLATPTIVAAPACHDALSATLVEAAGFPMAFMSGFAVSAVRVGVPDVGLLSYGEMVDAGRLIAGAVSIPVIGDADTGYGNAMNVRRTVAGYRQAGMAGAIIEDQVWPKACGHTRGRRVVSREEAVMRVRAAVDERDQGADDIVIVARSDARQAESLDEALWRAAAFADVGADMVFVDALGSADEMRAFCRAVPNTPKLANMLEGGGRTPILSQRELQDMGFAVVVYPLSLLGVSMRAMQDALAALASGRLPPPSMLPRFEEMQEVVRFPQYYAVEQRYSTSNASPPDSLTGSGASTATAAVASAAAAAAAAAAASAGAAGAASAVSNEQETTAATAPEAGASAGGSDSGSDGVEVVEPAMVLPPGSEDSYSSSSSSGGGGGGSGRDLSRREGLTLRVRITDRDGSVKLDVRVPGGFLAGLASTIPAVAGLDLRRVLEQAQASRQRGDGAGAALVDVDDGNGGRVQITVE